MAHYNVSRGINILLIATPALVGLLFLAATVLHKPKTIKVGILHSITGHMAESERGVVDATLCAIKEINKQGGVLGKMVEPIIADGRSEPGLFAQAAKDLFINHRVAAVFGCWTSSSRKAVKPLVEKHNNLLFYPVQYEGLEQSPNIIYTGLTVNQQLIPGIIWMVQHFGKRLFFVGSDYIFPHAAHDIIKEFSPHIGANIIGEVFLPPGTQKVKTVIEQIKKIKPDVIINCINGTTNNSFFKELRAAGILSKDIPTLSSSIAEQEIKHIGPELLDGDFVVWSYLQSLHSKKNSAFLSTMRHKYGPQKTITDPAEAGYTNVHLWAEAANRAGSINIKKIKKEITNESFDAPQGAVFIDEKTFHAWKTIRIARIARDGECTTIWDSEKPIKPIPYPSYRSKASWQRFLMRKYQEWGQQWENKNDT